MNITVAVMAHPKRRLQAEYLGTILKYYPFMDVSIVYDEIGEEWHTGKRALLRGANRGDWHVVIQDDAILTPNFYENIEGAINSLDTKTLISLYTGTARPLPDRVSAAVEKAADGNMLESHQLFWGVGIALPADHIMPMLDYVEKIELQYDNKIGEFYRQNALPVYYTMPSLVDHDDDLGTLLEGHGHHISPEPRKAHRLAAGLVSWNKKRIYI